MRKSLKARSYATLQMLAQQAKLASAIAVRKLFEHDLQELENARINRAPDASRIRKQWYTVDSPEVKAMSKR
ncbi:coil containing protein [Vibrio phage 1.209.O._10N.222.52.B2]|nr:coil containing protein [Vibrio phage 1.209.O._10N.222.52.B2]